MANLLTGLRLLLVVPVCWGLGQPAAISPWLLLAGIVLAIVSDFCDGIVARARGTASARGMLFDHATDFLFVTAGLSTIAWHSGQTLILPGLIIIAFSQYVLDSYFLFRQKQLRMSTLGRWNGILYFAPLLTTAMASLPTAATFTTIMTQATTWLWYGLLISSAASIVDRAIAPWRQAGTQ